MPKTFHTLLLDWDGTTANSLPAWIETYQMALAAHGVRMTQTDIVESLFRDWDSAEQFGIKDINSFEVEMLKHMPTQIPFAALHEGAAVSLEHFKQQGKNLAVVTSSHRTIIDQAIEHHHLTDVFDIVLTREDVTHTKPHPEMLLKAMEHVHAKPETTLIIGDSDVDIAAGKAAGVTTVAFYPQINEVFYTPAQIQAYHADYVVHSFDELHTLIGKNDE